MKSKRHLKIIQIIKENNISTQEELAEQLQAEGIDVTQATVSRDIKDLGFIKVPSEDGNYKYALPPERERITLAGWVKRMFRDFITDIKLSENNMVVKTLPGTAHSLAAAIDNLEWEEIIGSVAGDDCIIIVLADKNVGEEIQTRFKEMIGLQ